MWLRRRDVSAAAKGLLVGEEEADHLVIACISSNVPADMMVWQTVHSSSGPDLPCMFMNLIPSRLTRLGAMACVLSWQLSQ